MRRSVYARLPFPVCLTASALSCASAGSIGVPPHDVDAHSEEIPWKGGFDAWLNTGLPVIGISEG